MRNLFVAIAGVIIGGVIALAYVLFVPNALLGLPGSQRTVCGGDPHCLEVSVIPVGGQLQIAPIADHIEQDQGVVIFWKIATPGYRFPANGIAFNKPGNPAPHAEFNCGPVSNTTFRCTDRNQSKGTFGYTVTLDGVPPVPPLDPYIINN
jgi:hypothetical protein